MFERIAIVGLDGLGASIGLAARRAWPSALVIGVDRNDVLDEAMRLHVMDVASHDIVLISHADLVILAGPAAANIETLSLLADTVPGEAVVTPLAARSAPLLAAARDLPPRFGLIVSHPLPAVWPDSIRGADADMLVGRPWLLVPGPSASDPVVDRLTRFVAGLGAAPRRLDPDAHDRGASDSGAWDVRGDEDA